MLAVLIFLCVCVYRTLGEVVLNFPSFLEEVTMTADPECVRLKNYAEEDSQLEHVLVPHLRAISSPSRCGHSVHSDRSVPHACRI